MPNTSISDLISEFTSKLSLLVRRSALEQVLASMGGESPAQKRRGRPPGSKHAKPKGRRFKAAPADIREKLLAHVKANPGQRGEQIAAALKTDVGTMRPTMHKLIAEKLVRTEGQRRGMRYYPVGSAPKQPEGKRRVVRKTTQRRAMKAASSWVKVRALKSKGWKAARKKGIIRRSLGSRSLAQPSQTKDKR